jgi:predicted protein tyrosine phosphatase
VTLVVCPLAEVDAQIGLIRPARMVSLLSPQQAAPATPAGVHHLVLRFHDIGEPAPGLIAPDEAVVAQLLAFGGAWSEPGPMLIHCWMGISRSPAAALAIACACSPGRREQDVAQSLRASAPTATPNPLLIAVADRLLLRDGRLVAAARSIGRGAEAAQGSVFQLRARPGATGKGRTVQRG